jgi:tape measure domain-containing protein
MANETLGAGSVGSASVEIRASVSKLRSDMRDAQRAVRQGGEEMARTASRAENALGNVAGRFRRDIAASTVSVNALNSSLASTGRLATLALATGGSAAAAVAVTRLADQYSNLEARIRLVLDASENLGDVQESLFRLAQQSRAPLEAVVTLYTRLRQSIADLGDAEAQSITRVLSQTLAISGAGPAETASFLRQISQALASGVLRGDEFNSVMENNSRFAALLAEQLGVGAGNLRAMAEQGQLTADIIRGAIEGGAGSIASEFGRMPLTIAGAYQQLENALARYVGQTDQGLGASRRLAEGISALAENFASLADAIAIVGAATAGAIAGRGVQFLQQQSGGMFSDAWADQSQELRRLQDQAYQINDTLSRIHGERMRSMAQIDELFRDEAQLNHAVDHWRNEVRRQAELGTPGTPGGRVSIAPSDATRRAGPATGDQQFEARISATERLAQVEHELATTQQQRMRIEHDLEHMNRALAGQNERLTQTVAAMDRQTGVAGVTMRGFGAVMGGVQRAASSLVSFLGGPWGVAITAAAFAIMYFRSESEKAARAQRNLGEALGVIANAAPAFEAAAYQIGEVNSETRTMTDLAGEAAQATDELAQRQRDAANAARDQAEATRVLSEMRRRDAIAAIEQALAEQRAEEARLSRLLDFNRANPQLRASGGRMPGLPVPVEVTGKDDTARLGELQRYIGILERGLESMRSGLLDPAGNRAPTSSGGGVSIPSPNRSLSSRIEQLREFVRLSGDMEEAMRRAAAFGGDDALQAIRSLLDMPEALGEAGGVSDPLLRFTETIERLNALKSAAGGVGAGLFDRQIVDSILEMNRSARLGVDAFAALEDAVSRGLITPEQAESARSSIRALGDDYERARSVVEDARGEMANVRREIEEIQRLTAQGIFSDIESNGVEGAALVDLLERMARAAGDAAEALGILDNVDLPETVSRQEAEQRLRDAAREGRDDLEERNRLFLRTRDIRDATADAIEQAFSDGDWRSAFADGLNSVLNSFVRRFAESLANAISDAATGAGGGSTGFLSTVISGVFGVFTGGKGGKGGKRADGGPVKAGMGYIVGEQGEEPFFPGVDGYIASNRAMKNALRSANQGASVRLVVEARSDGSVDLKIRAAEQRAIVEGGKLGASILAKTIKGRSSI